jgi:hypothetical protein
MASSGIRGILAASAASANKELSIAEKFALRIFQSFD